MPVHTVAAAVAAACLAFAGAAFAQDGCAPKTRYGGATETPPPPAHVVSFVFTGVEDERVVLTVDETPVFEARLTTEDWSTEFSGATQCLMAGRHRINVKIGDAEGDLYFDISEETTVYLAARRGVLSFNVWGPDAPGLD